MVNSVTNDTHLSLQGKCIISTRPAGKSYELSQLLNNYGASLLELPMIELTEIKCEDSECKILGNYDSYTHVVFTSSYGFEFFLKK